jgi:hypothetical protein
MGGKCHALKLKQLWVRLSSKSMVIKTHLIINIPLSILLFKVCMASFTSFLFIVNSYMLNWKKNSIPKFSAFVPSFSFLAPYNNKIAWTTTFWVGPNEEKLNINSSNVSRKLLPNLCHLQPHSGNCFKL